MGDLRILGVERKKRIRIAVNGTQVPAYEGETVYAALLAAGYRVFHRSKTGQARGGFCGMGVCFDCLVTIDGVPNQRSCMTEVADGMEIRIHE